VTRFNRAAAAHGRAGLLEKKKGTVTHPLTSIHSFFLIARAFAFAPEEKYHTTKRQHHLQKKVLRSKKPYLALSGHKIAVVLLPPHVVCCASAASFTLRAAKEVLTDRHADRQKTGKAGKNIPFQFSPTAPSGRLDENQGSVVSPYLLKC
jgi:hypothetical protein